MWRCRVCDGVNKGGRTCATCGHVVSLTEPLRAAQRVVPPATIAPAPPRPPRRVESAPPPPRGMEPAPPPASRIPTPEEIFGSNPYW